MTTLRSGIGSGGKVPEGEDVSICIADSLCCQQELTQHCEEIILQFEKKKIKLKK